MVLGKESCFNRKQTTTWESGRPEVNSQFNSLPHKSVWRVRSINDCEVFSYYDDMDRGST